MECGHDVMLDLPEELTQGTFGGLDSRAVRAFTRCARLRPDARFTHERP